ncbi:transposase (plasmid) [Rhodococcus sp. USK10]|uniref:transposase n=1 Tax=Rhodococcus sp. USK10 TaxID=2789739 RepID=UPI001C5DA17D|nr:transposase [Rhodococcus sp. USK10]
MRRTTRSCCAWTRSHRSRPWTSLPARSPGCAYRAIHQEFLVFLKRVARAYPERELYLVMDNYATHKKAEVRAWLAEHRRIHVRFTPTSASWMNLVEVWFGIIERQAILDGTFGSVKDLTTKIRAFIN